MNYRHLVVGAGPVGSTIALQLASAGHNVVVLTRSGTGPSHPNISLVSGDASDVQSLVDAGKGAVAMFNCVNPPYHRWPQDWPPLHRAFIAAASTTGAVLAMADNLYALGPETEMPMRESSPMTATGRKGAVRRMMAQELLAAHAEGRIRATLVRASDFFGPGVRMAALGERVVPRVIAGKKVTVLGDADQPHVVSYMPDVAATLIAAATNEQAWGKAWQVPNAPAQTQRELVDALAAAAGTSVKVAGVPKIALRLAGLFVPQMRELAETSYQFERPWTTDSTHTEAVLGVSATPLDHAAAATVRWWSAEVGDRSTRSTAGDVSSLSPSARADGR